MHKLSTTHLTWTFSTLQATVGLHTLKASDKLEVIWLLRRWIPGWCSLREERLQVFMQCDIVYTS